MRRLRKIALFVCVLALIVSLGTVLAFAADQQAPAAGDGTTYVCPYGNEACVQNGACVNGGAYCQNGGVPGGGCGRAAGRGMGCGRWYAAQ